MAMGKKATLEVELHPDTIEMLEYARETYEFRSKIGRASCRERV